jgi:trigger factor
MTDETPSTEATATATETPVDAPATEEGGEPKPQKLQQTVEMKDVGPCKKHIKVVVDRKDIDEQLNKKFSELVKESNVPGFRPGKAPRKVVTRLYRKEVVDQIKGQVLLASLEQLAEDHDIAPLSAPNIDPSKIDIPEEGPFVYEFDVEVRPQFDLPDYKGLKLKRPVRTFSDEDVEREEKRILARYGRVIPKEGGTVELGDYIVTDLTTRQGDQTIGTAKEITIRVEPRLAFKDGVAEQFGQHVVGAKAGDVRVVDIVMSDSVAVGALAGKTVQATFEIKDVKQQQLPELTHEFLHTFGVHSPEQLREQVRMLLDRRLEYEQRQSAREQVLARITDASQWDLPQDLLMRQARKALARKVMEMREAGMSEEEILGRERMMRQDVLRSTEASLKEHFVLQKIAETEKIDVSEDEINEEIERIAEQNNEAPRRVRARFEKEDLLDTLAAQIIERKTLDLVLGSAEYEDVQVGAEAEKAIATSEQQAVPGEMKDPTAAPPAAEQGEGEATA